MAPLDAADLHARVKARFGESIGELTGTRRDNASARVAPAAIVEVCRFLKTEPGLEFDCLSNLSGVDYPKRSVIEVVYHLYSYRHRHLFTLKVDAPRDAPVVPSVASIWRHADWPGHPLRKDFVEPEEYHGISTSRESLLKAT